MERRAGTLKHRPSGKLRTAVLPLVALVTLLILPRIGHCSQYTLSWDPPVTAVAGYRLYYGTAPGTYTQGVDAGNVTSYTVGNLAIGVVYYFSVTAYDASGNESGYSNEVCNSVMPPSSALSHYRYNYPIGGGSNCGLCHVKKGTFLGGFGVRTSVNLCHSCHSLAGVGHERPYGGKAGHPVFVNVTADARHKWPSLGFVNGTSSDKTYTHLYRGRKVVCMSCHNSHQKPNDPGRTWELTNTADCTTYYLQNGGWAGNAYLKPVVYRSTTLWYGPTYLRDYKQYMVPPAEYDTDMQNGAIVFHQPQPAAVYIYVTLLNDYLRNPNTGNRLCTDCHITTAHKQLDCTTCHGSHNTDNLYNIRSVIRTPQGILRNVSYSSKTAMSGKAGVCVVCHTKTKYHNYTALRPVPHYDNQDCTACHKHAQGFPIISG